MHHIWLFCLLYLGHTTDPDSKCSNNSCCSGFYFDSTGNCVVCPGGYYGKNCSFPCPIGYYGDGCRKLCDCSKEICNAIFGCKKFHGLNYLDPVSLPTIVLTVLGLLTLFIFSGTLLVLKMRKKTQVQNLQVKLKSHDVTSPSQDEYPTADLCVPDDFLPLPEDKDFTESQEQMSVYESCF